MHIIEVITIVCMSYLFVFKQKTAYEMRISDWSSDVSSSDLFHGRLRYALPDIKCHCATTSRPFNARLDCKVGPADRTRLCVDCPPRRPCFRQPCRECMAPTLGLDRLCGLASGSRSEEHTSELQSLMRISYAVFCLKKKNKLKTKKKQ